jgi:predicted nucleic acid-binding Zn ribbon protein
VTNEQTPQDDAGQEATAVPDLASQLLARARASAPTPGTGPAVRRRKRTRRSGSADADYSGAGPDDRDPQPVGVVARDLVDERGWSQPLAIGGVEGRWPQIVGAEVAAHCVPEEFEAGRLTVRADSTAWATQVRLLAPNLLARLNDDLGGGTVTALQVVGPRGPSWRKGRLRVKGRGPRDTYG